MNIDVVLYRRSYLAQLNKMIRKMIRESKSHSVKISLATNNSRRTHQGFMQMCSSSIFICIAFLSSHCTHHVLIAVENCLLRAYTSSEKRIGKKDVVSKTFHATVILYKSVKSAKYAFDPIARI